MDVDGIGGWNPIKWQMPIHVWMSISRNWEELTPLPSPRRRLAGAGPAGPGLQAAAIIALVRAIPFSRGGRAHKRMGLSVAELGKAKGRRGGGTHGGGRRGVGARGGGAQGRRGGQRGEAEEEDEEARRPRGRGGPPAARKKRRGRRP